MATIVKTEGLTKIYKGPFGGEVVAVRDLNLEVEEGEIFGFLGPNGSGKTTTIKLLLGLTFPTSGQAWIFGREPRDVETKQRIGYLPEMPYLYDYLTAKELLDFYGKIFGLNPSERSKRIDDLLKLVGLSHVRNTQISKFSKGMMQRIGVAQALINDPDLLFLDEPTLGLDPIGAKEMKDLMLELKQRGKTLFYCTHALAEAETICDRVGIINEGTLIRLGRLEELLIATNQIEVIAENVNAEAIKGLKALKLEPIKQGQRVLLYHQDRDLLLKAIDVIKENKGDPISFSYKHESLEDFFVRAVREVEESRVQEAPQKEVQE